MPIDIDDAVFDPGQVAKPLGLMRRLGGQGFGPPVIVQQTGEAKPWPGLDSRTKPLLMLIGLPLLGPPIIAQTQTSRTAFPTAGTDRLGGVVPPRTLLLNIGHPILPGGPPLLVSTQNRQTNYYPKQGADFLGGLVPQRPLLMRIALFGPRGDGGLAIRQRQIGDTLTFPIPGGTLWPSMPRLRRIGSPAAQGPPILARQQYDGGGANTLPVFLAQQAIAMNWLPLLGP